MSSPPTDQWLIGVALILAASFVGGLGDNLVRCSHRRKLENSKDDDDASNSLFNLSLIWITGMMCTILLNTILTLWAFAYADSSLIVPFAGTHVIFAVLLAIILNNENVSLRSWAVLGLILVGIVMTVIAGNKETMSYSLEVMIALFGETAFIAAGAVCLLICCSSFFAYMTPGLTPGFQALAISTVAGTLGSIGTVFAKLVVEVIKDEDPTKFQRPTCWILLVIAVAFGLAQITAYNEALKSFDASIVGPIVLSVLTVGGTSLGAIFFQEYKRFQMITMIMMPIGVLVTVIGVLLLSTIASEEYKTRELYGDGNTCCEDARERETLLKLSEETQSTGTSI